MEIYVVQPDDSVEKIAGIFGADPEAVIYANQLSEPYLLAEGQALLDSCGAEALWMDLEGNLLESPGFSDYLRT